MIADAQLELHLPPPDEPDNWHDWITWLREQQTTKHDEETEDE